MNDRMNRTKDTQNKVKDKMIKSREKTDRTKGKQHKVTKNSPQKSSDKKVASKEVKHMVFALGISPTGNTEKAVRYVASGIADKLSGGDYFYIDITQPDARDGVYEFGAGDIVILGCPTYAGRIPNKLMPYIKESIYGSGAIGISLVTYGNRAYDDALKEMAYIMQNNDFEMLAALAVPAEHAFSSMLAEGRPNNEDLDNLYSFGIKIGETIKSGKYKTLNLPAIPGRMPEEMKYYVPKKENGEAASFLKAMPITDESKCTGCGECRRKCTMGCYDNSLTQPEGICIKCQGCIKACPNGAKRFDDADFLSHVGFLEKNYSNVVREIEFFV